MKTLIVATLVLASINLYADAKTKNKRKAASQPHRCVENALERAPKLFKVHLPESEMIVDQESVTSGKQGKLEYVSVIVADGNVPYELKFYYNSKATGCVLEGQQIIDLKNLK